MARIPENRSVSRTKQSPQDAPLMRLLRRGVFAREACSDVACHEVMTARCVYVDRHGVACPTHWCAKHVHGIRRKPYCGAHAVSASTTPVVDHRIATALDWVARAIDDDIVALLRPAAEKVDENLLSEPVKFGAVGLERVRTWERTWKTYSDLGVGCRVSLGIEDRLPDMVQLRVNSNVVTSLATPWEAVELRDARTYSDRLVPPLVVPAQFAVEVWLHNVMVQLKGAPFPPRH